MTRRLILATRNAGKARELATLLGGLGFDLRTLADHPEVSLPLEGVTSYADNACAKARATAAGTAAFALGDDSGLEVDALDGRPGVASARYGGPGLSDAERVARLLAEVGPSGARTARFRCVLALVAPWGEEALVEGVVEGRLTSGPRGTGGFGYDPIFLVPELGRTFAELTVPEKAQWSHRGRAGRAARPVLANWVGRAG